MPTVEIVNKQAFVTIQTYQGATHGRKEASQVMTVNIAHIAQIEPVQSDNVLDSEFVTLQMSFNGYVVVKAADLRAAMDAIKRSGKTDDE